MVKLSQQLQQDLPQARATRTQRLGARQETTRSKIEAQRLKNAQDKLSKANFDNYEQIYNSINPKYRTGYLTPTQLKQTDDYKQFQQQRTDTGTVDWLISKASKIDRGKPFAMWGSTSQQVALVNAYREGIGTGSKQERRARFLQQQFPNLEKGELVQAVNVGTVQHFGQTRQVHGLGVGEQVSITTVDNKTGEVKSEILYAKTRDPVTRNALTTKQTTTFKSSAEIQAEREVQYQDFLKENPAPKLDPEQKVMADDRSFFDKGKDFVQDFFTAPFKDVKQKGILRSFYIDPTAKIIGGTQGLAMAGLDFIAEVIKPSFKYVDERVHFDQKISIDSASAMPLKLSLISFGKRDTPTRTEKSATFIQEGLGKKSADVRETEMQRVLAGNYDFFKEQKQEKAKEDLTGLFYRSELGKEAFRSAETEAEINASFKEYTEGEEFKQYSTDYSKQYQEDLKNLYQNEVPYLEKVRGGTIAGVKIVGLNLASLGVGVASSPTKIAGVVVAVSSASALLKSLPKGFGTAMDFGYTTYGGVKILDPKSSFEERGTGAIMFGVGATSLSIRGSKYLSKQTYKKVKVDPPTMKEIRASQTIGRDTQFLTKGGEFNKVDFITQKKVVRGFAGQRTITSRVWRDILRGSGRKLGLDLSDDFLGVYHGVPSAQAGTRSIFTGFRSSTQVVSPSVYQKELALLQKTYGISSFKAEQILRYTAPRVIESSLSRGSLVIKGGKAQGEFLFLQTQPVIDVNKVLGIKTRGARTIADVVGVERQVVNLDKIGNVILQKRATTSFFLQRGASKFDFKSYTEHEGILTGISSKDKVYKQLISQKGGIKVFDTNLKYNDILGVSIERQVFPSKNVLRMDIDRTTLFKQIKDLTNTDDMLTIQKGKKASSFATPTSKENVDMIKNILKEVQQPSRASSINKAVKGFDDFTGTPKVVVKQDAFYGTGQYERTGGGGFRVQDIGTQADPQLKQLLRTQFSMPDAKIGTRFKDLVNVGDDIRFAGGLKVAGALKVGTLFGLKGGLNIDNGLRADFKLHEILKDIIKVGEGTGGMASPTTSTPMSLQVPTIPAFRTPVFRDPPIIEPQLTIPTLPIYFPNKARKGKKKSKSTKQIQDLLFLPDFTSRLIGLKAETITEKQAQAKLKKILTGLEIRRGVVIK